MTPEEIVARAFNRPVSEIVDATTSDDVDEWDSLGHITLIIELEAAYGVSFSPATSVGMTSVAAIKKALLEQGATW